jgi:hypothetical protein
MFREGKKENNPTEKLVLGSQQTSFLGRLNVVGTFLLRLKLHLFCKRNIFKRE